MGANIGSGPTAFEQLIQKVITGLAQVIPPKSNLVVDGTPMTPVQIVAKLQPILTELQAVRSARSDLESKLQAAKVNHPGEHEFLMAVHAALVAQLGRKNPQLAQFGFTPTKQRQMPVAVKTTAAAKRKTTRGMRHTMGKRQKQDVKAVGNPDVTISNRTASINAVPAPAAQASATPAPAVASGAQGASQPVANDGSGNGAAASGSNGPSKP